MKRQRHPRRRLVVRRRGAEGVLVGLTERDKWSWPDTMVLRGEMRRLAAGGWRRISIDLEAVAILPSGFFNMLCEWQEESRGELFLLNPRAAVQRTLWFRLFTEQVFSAEGTDETFRMCLEPRTGAPDFADQRVEEDIELGTGSGEFAVGSC